MDTEKLFAILSSRAVQIVTFFLAAALGLVIFLLPPLIAESTATLSHSALSLCLMGVCLGFAHGVGFTPESKTWRWFFSPLVSWPLMLVGGLQMYS